MKSPHKMFSTKYTIIGISSLLVILAIVENFVTKMKDLEWISNVVLVITLWAGCSTILKKLDKHLPWDKKPIKRVIIELIAVGLFSIIIFYIYTELYYLISPNLGNVEYYEISMVFTVLISYSVVTIVEAIAFYRSMIESKLQTSRLEKENIKAQYDILKNQIDPHFLFNSLNTLASYVEHDAHSSEYVQKLSEFLRYGLTLKDEEVIRLEDELQIVEKYIFIQKSRFKKGLDINIDIKKEYKSRSYVAPFCLQMLIENAIKHNIVSKSKPLSIEVKSDGETISVTNNLQIRETLNSTKTGLSNIAERYRILCNKEIKISKSLEEYRVELPLIKTDSI